MKFNHIGYVVENLKNSVRGFKSLGYESSDCFIDINQNIEIVLLNKDFSPIIELIHPIDEFNSLNRFINDGQKTVSYHIAYEVIDIRETMSFLRKEGFVPCMNISKAVAFNDIPFVFLNNHQTGLIELLEKND